MKPSCADRRLPRRARSRPARGFTLLEIMVSVAVLGMLIPLLRLREQASARVERALNLLEATSHAETLLARRLRDVQPVDGEEGYVEDDPHFRYQLTLENFDLSTGRSEEEEEDWQEQQDSLFGAGTVPPDAAVAESAEEDKANPHLVRRFELRLLWPHEEEADAERELVLEGFLPRIWEDSSTRLLNTDGSGASPDR